MSAHTCPKCCSPVATKGGSSQFTCPRCGYMGSVPAAKPEGPAKTKEAAKPEEQLAPGTTVFCKGCGGKIVTTGAEGTSVTCPKCSAVNPVRARNAPLTRGPAGYVSTAGRAGSSVEKSALTSYYMSLAFKALIVLAVAALALYFVFFRAGNTIKGTITVQQKGSDRPLSAVCVYLLPATVDKIHFFKERFFDSGLDEAVSNSGPGVNRDTKEKELRNKLIDLPRDVDLSLCETFYSQKHTRHVAIDSYQPIALDRTLSDADGRFAFKKLKAGRYYVCALAQSGDQSLSWLMPVDLDGEAPLSFDTRSAWYTSDMNGAAAAAGAVVKSTQTSSKTTPSTGSLNVDVKCDYCGARADSRSVVLLLPRDFKEKLDANILAAASLGGSLKPETRQAYLKSGVFLDVTSTSGRVGFLNVKTGSYKLVIISGSTTCMPDARKANEGLLQQLCDSPCTPVAARQIYTEDVELPPGPAKSVTHDFGATAF